MGEESIAVELTESEIYMVKTMAVLSHALYKLQNGPGTFTSLYKNIELKMLRALDAIQAKKAEKVK